jgi:hypothetical protein
MKRQNAAPPQMIMIIIVLKKGAAVKRRMRFCLKIGRSQDSNKRHRQRSLQQMEEQGNPTIKDHHIFLAILM